MPWLPWLLLVLTSAMVVVLGLRTRALRSDVVELQRRADWPHPGMAVPSFQGVTLTGDTVIVGGVGGQVLLFFDTRCGNCVVTLPAWERLAEAGAGRGLHVIGVSVDPEPDTRSYVANHGLGFPVVLVSDPRIIELYRISGVPVSMVVGPAGRVSHVHLGSIFQDSPAVDSLVAAAVSAAESRDQGEFPSFVSGGVP